MSEVSFEVSKSDRKLIDKIVARAMRIAEDFPGLDVDEQSMNMDITACHANGCPLRLKYLLDARKGDFGHDVFGIRRFINRDTGKLSPKFCPRCAVPEKVKK